MAEAVNQWEKSDALFNAVSKSDYILKMDLQTRLFHPAEIILWKYGYYCAQKGMTNAAIKYYEKASEICFSSTNLTLNIIGIGIELEQHGFILKDRKKDAVSHNKRLMRKWNRVKNADYKGILENLFGTVDLQNEAPEYFIRLGRKITF